MRKPLSAIYRIIERLALNQFDVVFAENSYARDYPWVRKHMTVLNLPDVGLLQGLNDGSKFPNFTVGYIGGGTEERGVVSVAHALQKLRARGAEFEYQCIGPMNATVLGNETFNDGINEGWISAPGRMSGTDGWKIISRCHVGVALLQPIPNYVDSWPTKMFEYMAMGLPVIVSNFPLYRDVVERHECGICVDPMDTTAIAEAIDYLANHPEEAKRIGDNGKAAVQQYNWNNEEAKLVALYGELIREAA
jgi:glycosyltransferase involved in cell wall biosynthesis